MSKRSSLFNDDGSSFLSSESSCLSQFLLRSQNPYHVNQTLEDAFAGLSVSASSFNHPPLDLLGPGSSSGVNGNAKILSRFSYESGTLVTPQSSDLYPSSFPTFSANVFSSSYDHGFLDSEPLARQREFGNVYPTVPLSNGVQQKPLGSNLLNDCWGNRSSGPRFNVDERRLQWFNDFRGRVLLLAMDQHECRTLQETLKILKREELSIIFSELINHVVELIVDPFGNYVVQRMVEICSKEQRTQIILMLTQSNLQLVRICLTPHGARTVEKLLAHVTTQEQRGLIMSVLSPSAAVLAKDMNGHRVLLHCLKHFSEEDTKHLLNVVAIKCFGIATDKTGCCVLQQCVNHAQGETKRQLIAAIIRNAALLAEDSYGNYVVQHLLSQKIPGVVESLMRQLEQNFFHLACNKYGSNVVEKFFHESGEQHSSLIILELLHNPNVAMLLVDPYGNYVIKSALSASRGALRDALENLIQLNSMMMCSNLYGKKLLGCQVVFVCSLC
ncbi:putative pumilio homolog 8, chloroplastic [Abrus precatorius]|uniref:Pumilio homolog 8, chloroplastic n=1 Tax=Abrus precatorius TaxID=3816 RepID=A0A8B8LKM5_ABRPR|nr:putative pumilio homolog 8, chloroplastic [Abrus precatorius]